MTKLMMKKKTKIRMLVPYPSSSSSLESQINIRTKERTRIIVKLIRPIVFLAILVTAK